MRPNAWHYRDYVIAANRTNRKPLSKSKSRAMSGAGDTRGHCRHEPPSAVLGPTGTARPTPRRSRHARGGTGRSDQRRGPIVLGLTVNCAALPRPQVRSDSAKRYYRIKAVFEGPPRRTPSPLPRRSIRQSVSPRSERESPRSSEMPASRSLRFCHRPGIGGSAHGGEPKRTELADRARPRKIEVDSSASRMPVRKEPEPTRCETGDVKTPADIVSPGALSAIEQPPSDFGLEPNSPEAERRRKLAAWIADARNPLTARAIVNRLWQHHFGAGIVATPNDLGASGAKPSHPELLDWLAGQLMEHGWSLKALHRLIVGSAAYRQASAFRPAAAELDAENQLLWRYSPRRLEAEALRDAMLSASGQLNPALGGPSFRPFETRFQRHVLFPRGQNRARVCPAHGLSHERNSGKDPMLDAFDCPDPRARRRAAT